MKRQSNFLFQILTLLGVFSLVAFSSISITAQSRSQLESQRFAIIKEIDDTNKLLEETEKNQKTLVSDLSIIQKQITNRKKLLEQIQKEIAFVDVSIGNKDEYIKEFQLSLDSLKTQYQIILRAAFREKKMRDPLVSLLSLKSMSETFLKENYYNSLRSFIVNKFDAIQSNTIQIEQEIAKLNTEKNNKILVLEEVKMQSELLVSEQDRQKDKIASLKEDESALKSALDKQKLNRESMNVSIEKIINSKFGLSNTAFIPASNEKFASKKGNLNWPVKGGVVSSKYGKQRHHTIRNLMISNNGIDIRAPRSSEVMVIAAGEVVGISEMNGFGKMVIVNHKDYYTVYSKMENVFVTKGQILSENELLGILAVKRNLSELHFEIWRNNETVNPETWLK